MAPDLVGERDDEEIDYDASSTLDYRRFLVKKGRHRRFEEARALKRGSSFDFSVKAEPCPECDSAPGQEHASWCMFTPEEETEEF